MLSGTPSAAGGPLELGTRFQDLPRYVLAPLPLFVVQPLITRVVSGLASRHPRLFERLAHHQGKRVLIDPLNLPFALSLHVTEKGVIVRAIRRTGAGRHDARIAGTCLTLLELIEGESDSDALFFTRDLMVEGDTEVVVALRNTLDDVDGSLAEDVAAHAGAMSPVLRAVLVKLRTIRKRHA